jgi:hypothetical protein
MVLILHVETPGDRPDRHFRELTAVSHSSAGEGRAHTRGAPGLYWWAGPDGSAIAFPVPGGGAMNGRLLSTTGWAFALTALFLGGGLAPARDTVPPRPDLRRVVDLRDGIGPRSPLADTLEFLGERYGVSVTVDRDAFKARGIDDVAKRPVGLPKLLGVRLDFTLHLLLSEVGATYRVRDGKVVVEPLADAKPLAERLPEGRPEREKEASEKLARSVELRHGLDDRTPLRDVLQFLSDRYDMTIVIDRAGFRAANVKEAGDQPVKLPPLKDVSLEKVLNMLLAQVKGTFKNWDGLILVTPEAK